jgi:hypothetical protein
MHTLKNNFYRKCIFRLEFPDTHVPKKITIYNYAKMFRKTKFHLWQKDVEGVCWGKARRNFVLKWRQFQEYYWLGLRSKWDCLHEQHAMLQSYNTDTDLGAGIFMRSVLWKQTPQLCFISVDSWIVKTPSSHVKPPSNTAWYQGRFVVCYALPSPIHFWYHKFTYVTHILTKVLETRPITRTHMPFISTTQQKKFTQQTILCNFHTALSATAKYKGLWLLSSDIFTCATHYSTRWQQ